VSRVKVAHITTVDMSLRFLLLHQLKSLQEAGYDVVGISAPGPDASFVEAAGIRHIPVLMTRNLTPFADVRSLWQLYRIMCRERFSIVHTHTPKPGLLGQLAARMAGVPIVVNTLHGFYFHERMRRLARRFYISLEKIAAACSDRILSQNQEDIATALRESICSAGKIEHLGNGIDLNVFDPNRFTPEATQRLRNELQIPLGAKVVGFVGRLAAKRKGFLDFLRAGAELSKRDPKVCFVIAGHSDPGKPDAVQPEVAKEFGIWDRCRFLGLRDNAELPSFYALMDVVVLPSLFEGVPRVLMEAAAMGVPAVASDVKGNRETVIDGQTGFLVPFADVNALAEAIEKLLRDPSLAYRMGQAARRLADERFDERRVFEQVKRAYLELLERKGLVPLHSPGERRGVSPTWPPAENLDYTCRHRFPHVALEAPA
jgi:glycosyltransferase involved in cell wall biosynthesis